MLCLYGRCRRYFLGDCIWFTSWYIGRATRAVPWRFFEQEPNVEAPYQKIQESKQLKITKVESIINTETLVTESLV
jgi:hypothetical protein